MLFSFFSIEFCASSQDESDSNTSEETIPAVCDSDDDRLGTIDSVDSIGSFRASQDDRRNDHERRKKPQRQIAKIKTNDRKTMSAKKKKMKQRDEGDGEDITLACPHCDFTSDIQKGSIQTHIKMRHPEKFLSRRQCRSCGERFHSHKFLVAHKRKKHKVKVKRESVEMPESDDRHDQNAGVENEMSKTDKESVKGRETDNDDDEEVYEFSLEEIMTMEEMKAISKRYSPPPPHMRVFFFGNG